MVFAPVFAELETEREVVLEEIAMYEDAPQELVHDLIADAVFGDHPLGRPVIGTAEVISSIPQEAIARYHDEMYVPANIVFAAAGNIHHDEIVELVQQGLARRGGNVGARANLRPPLVQAPPPQLRFQRKDTEQYHVCLAAPGISRSDRRRFASSLLDAILGGSASSRLFQEIREKRGLAYAVYSFISQYTDTGQIGVYLGTREDNLAEALAITAEQIARHRGRATSPRRELERAKENLKGRILLSMESTSTRMNRLGKSLITDSELLSLDRIVAEIDAVEPTSSASSRQRCSHRTGSPRRASARTRSGSSPRSSGSRPTSRAPRERSPERAARQGRVGARRRASRRPATCWSTSSTPRTRWSTSRTPTRSPRTSGPRVAAGVPSVVGTTGWETAEFDERAGQPSSMRRTSRSAPC